MKSKFDRLFSLLCSPNRDTRIAVGERIGDIAGEHPNDLPQLLQKIQSYLHHKKWETRIAAGQSLESIAKAVPGKDSDKEDVVDNITEDVEFKRVHQQYIDGLCTLNRFSLKHILGSRLLLSTSNDNNTNGGSPSSGNKTMLEHRNEYSQEYGLLTKNPSNTSTPTSNANDTNGEKKNVKKKNKNVDEEDDPIRKKMLEIETMLQDSKTSARKKNQLKRKLNTLQKILGKPTIRRSRGEITTKSCVEIEDDKDTLVIKSEVERKWVFQNDNYWPFHEFVLFLENSLFHPMWEVRHGACLALSSILLHHVKDAGTRISYKGGNSYTTTVTTSSTTTKHQSDNYAWLEDCACRLLIVILQDRFTDFMGDSIVTPVKEVASQTIALIIPHLEQHTVLSLFTVLDAMLKEHQWEVRHSAFVILKYVVAANRKYREMVLQERLGWIVDGLYDTTSDDVRLVAVDALHAALAPRTNDNDSECNKSDDMGTSENSTSRTASTNDKVENNNENVDSINNGIEIPLSRDQLLSIIVALWHGVTDTDSLSASVGSMIQVIALIYNSNTIRTLIKDEKTLENGIPKMSTTSLPLTTPLPIVSSLAKISGMSSFDILLKLFPLTRHQLSSVRVASIETISPLLAVDKTTRSNVVIYEHIFRVLFHIISRDMNSSVVTAAKKQWELCVDYYLKHCEGYEKKDCGVDIKSGTGKYDLVDILICFINALSIPVGEKWPTMDTTIEKLCYSKNNNGDVDDNLGDDDDNLGVAVTDNNVITLTNIIMGTEAIGMLANDSLAEKMIHLINNQLFNQTLTQASTVIAISYIISYTTNIRVKDRLKPILSNIVHKKFLFQDKVVRMGKIFYFKEHVARFIHLLQVCQGLVTSLINFNIEYEELLQIQSKITQLKIMYNNNNNNNNNNNSSNHNCDTITSEMLWDTYFAAKSLVKHFRSPGIHISQQSLIAKLTTTDTDKATTKPTSKSESYNPCTLLDTRCARVENVLRTVDNVLLGLGQEFTTALYGALASCYTVNSCGMDRGSFQYYVTNNLNAEDKLVSCLTKEEDMESLFACSKMLPYFNTNEDDSESATPTSSISLSLISTNPHYRRWMSQRYSHLLTLYSLISPSSITFTNPNTSNLIVNRWREHVGEWLSHLAQQLVYVQGIELREMNSVSKSDGNQNGSKNSSRNRGKKRKLKNISGVSVTEDEPLLLLVNSTSTTTNDTLKHEIVRMNLYHRIALRSVQMTVSTLSSDVFALMPRLYELVWEPLMANQRILIQHDDGNMNNGKEGIHFNLDESKIEHNGNMTELETSLALLFHLLPHLPPANQHTLCTTHMRNLVTLASQPLTRVTPLYLHVLSLFVVAMGEWGWRRVATVLSTILPEYLALHYEEHTRLFSLRTIHTLVRHLYLKLLPWAIFFVIPLMRILTDQNPRIKYLAAQAFGVFVALLPLQKSVPEIEGLDDEMLEKKMREEKFFHQLFGGEKLDLYEVPIHLNSTLRKYQQEGVNWLAFLKKYGLNGILADDMGLGKTLQTICIVMGDIVEHLQERDGDGESLNSSSGAKNMKRNDCVILPSLIICPPTLLSHWYAEIEKFVPDRTLLEHVCLITDLPLNCDPKTMAQQHIVIASYSHVRKNIKTLGLCKWNYVVVDEGHIIRNAKTQTAKAIKQLPSQHRLILTGTPIQNNALELWSLFDFLMPGFLGTRQEFNQAYVLPVTKLRNASEESAEYREGQLALQRLHRQVLPFILRRHKRDVLKDLPPKIIADRYCELTPLQRMLYNEYNNSSIQKFGYEKRMGGANDEGDTKSGRRGGTFFEVLSKLRSLITHPKLAINNQHPLYFSYCSKMKSSGHTPLKLEDLALSAKLMALKELLIECGIVSHGGNTEGNSSEGNSIDNSSKGEDISDIVSSHRALIFCQQKSTIDMVEQLLHMYFPTSQYMRLDGDTPVNKRYGLCTQFNRDISYDLMVINTSVGGLGLNLTGADVVIFVEHDFNPMKDLQAMDRAHRIGLAETVVNDENTSTDTMNTDGLLDILQGNTIDDTSGSSYMSANVNIGSIHDLMDADENDVS